MTTVVPSSHAVSRSLELLSCAKTALKIAQNHDESHQHAISPTQLSLYDTDNKPSDSHVSLVLEDGLHLLRQLKTCLETLSSLVKRRGHTNDPTLEMQRQLDDFEQAARELSEIRVLPIPLVSKQQARHYQLVSAWLDAAATVYTRQLKQVMKLRAQVLADLAISRRQLLQQNSTTTTTTRRKQGGFYTKSAMNSPLFTAVSNHPTTTTTTTTAPSSASSNGGTRPTVANASHAAPARQLSAPCSFPTSASSNSNSSTVGYGGTANGNGGYYASSYGGVASYGGGTSTALTGMRQRKATTATNTTQNNNNTDYDMQVQLQEQQQRRDTRNRLQHARQAESTLAELGTLFGKMSSLISQQGEVLEKVEDDVEAALLDVSAGESEIQTLYTIKKGNRGLILKVFGILIFLIIFMRFY
jgi:ribosomal protein L16/L10AE